MADSKECDNNLFSRRFECKPLKKCELITMREKIRFENSDRIILPIMVLNIISKKTSDSVMTLRLYNKANKKMIYSGVGTFVNQKKYIYLPDRMMEDLGIKEDEEIFISTITLPRATSVKFKIPKSIKDPKPILEFMLKNHATLYNGKKFEKKMFEKVYVIEVCELKPKDAVIIIDVDLKFSTEYY
jgi:hypothetical protein